MLTHWDHSLRYRTGQCRLENLVFGLAPQHCAVVLGRAGLHSAGAGMGLRAVMPGIDQWVSHMPDKLSTYSSISQVPEDL